MARTMTPPYRQNDPSPGDRRRWPRVLIFILIVSLGVSLLVTGRDLQTVLIILVGVGLAGATFARWVTDDGPLPSLGSLAPRWGGMERDR